MITTAIVLPIVLMCLSFTLFGMVIGYSLSSYEIRLKVRKIFNKFH